VPGDHAGGRGRAAGGRRQLIWLLRQRGNLGGSFTITAVDAGRCWVTECPVPARSPERADPGAEGAGGGVDDEGAGQDGGGADGGATDGVGEVVEALGDHGRRHGCGQQVGGQDEQAAGAAGQAAAEQEGGQGGQGEDGGGVTAGHAEGAVDGAADEGLEDALGEARGHGYGERGQGDAAPPTGQRAAEGDQDRDDGHRRQVTQPREGSEHWGRDPQTALDPAVHRRVQRAGLGVPGVSDRERGTGGHA
jgi:hypothetical protein